MARLYDIHSKFTTQEFTCPCDCGFGSDPDDVSEELITKLNFIRYVYQHPLMVTSGARCVDYNRQVGGVEGSAHTPDPENGQCQAADILVRSGYDRALLLELAHRIGIQRIGITESFFHFDVATHLPSPRIWVYT